MKGGKGGKEGQRWGQVLSGQQLQLQVGEAGELLFVLGEMLVLVLLFL